MQGLLAVRDWNFWLRACASLPFCALKPAGDDELAAALGVGGGVLAADATEDGVDWVAEADTEGGEFGVVPFPALFPAATPGDWTRLTSCCPAVIGPEGFAGQLPGGFRGAF